MTLEELRSEIHDMLRGSIDAANLRNRGENLDCVNDSIESILAECRTSLSPTAAEESTGVEVRDSCRDDARSAGRE